MRREEWENPNVHGGHGDGVWGNVDDEINYFKLASCLITSQHSYLFFALCCWCSLDIQLFESQVFRSSFSTCSNVSDRIKGRRWYNGQHSCLPSSWSGFDSRPTQLFFLFLIEDWRRLSLYLIVGYDVNQDNTNWLRHWAHNISPATFCSHLLTMRLHSMSYGSVWGHKLRGGRQLSWRW